MAAPPQATSARKGGPSVVVMDELDEGVSILRRASRIRRGFAFGIDFGILSLVWVAVIGIFGGRFEMNPLLVLIPFAYLFIAVGDGLGGRSPGKWLAHLRVAHPNGTGPGLLAAIIRGLLCLPIVFMVALSRGMGPADAAALLQPFWSDLTVTQSAFDIFTKFACGAGLIDLGMTLFTRRREALHDLISGTSVFREQRVRKKQRKPKRKKKALLKKSPLRQQSEPLNPKLPTVASLLVPGLGQLTNGHGGKGLVFFIGVGVALIMDGMDQSGPWWWVAIWGLNVYEANRSAHRRLRQFKKDSASPSESSDF